MREGVLHLSLQQVWLNAGRYSQATCKFSSRHTLYHLFSEEHCAVLEWWNPGFWFSRYRFLIPSKIWAFWPLSVLWIVQIPNFWTCALQWFWSVVPKLSSWGDHHQRRCWHVVGPSMQNQKLLARPGTLSVTSYPLTAKSHSSKKDPQFHVFIYHCSVCLTSQTRASAMVSNPLLTFWSHTNTS